MRRQALVAPIVPVVLVAVVVAGGGVVVPGPAARLRQLTRGGGGAFPNTAPAVASDGRTVAFLSNADLTGMNPDRGWEIFLLRADGELRQLTDAPAGDSADPVLNLELSTDRAGERFAFSSTADLAGDNPDHNREIFLVDAAARVRQLTRTTGGPGYCAGNVQPALDAAGERVVFASDLDLLGKNPDGNCELFAVGADGRGLVQLTSGRGALGAVNPALSADARTVVFASDEDLAGENGDGNVELFVVDLAAEDGRARQLTRTTGGFYGFLGSFYPRVSADGRRVVFVSGRDLAGDNADGNAEIFTLLTDGSAPARQITRSASGLPGCLDNYFPSISGDGRKIAFTSLVDLGLGASGGDAADLYVADFDGARLTRVTASAHASDWPALDEKGTRVVFQSLADLGDDNPRHAAELFEVRLEE